MKTFLKSLSLVLIFSAITANAAYSQTEGKEKQKKHVCTELCIGDKHHYAHGEKRHKCSAECKAMKTGKMELKDHVCTEACTSEKHVYKHGEKGHVCDASCKH